MLVSIFSMGKYSSNAVRTTCLLTSWICNQLSPICAVNDTASLLAVANSSTELLLLQKKNLVVTSTVPNSLKLHLLRFDNHNMVHIFTWWIYFTTDLRVYIRLSVRAYFRTPRDNKHTLSSTSPRNLIPTDTYPFSRSSFLMVSAPVTYFVT